MKYIKRLFQPYYLLAVLAGAGLFWYDAQNQNAAYFFFGFAENLETEVNFNYPVIVTDIPVEEGQFVSKGEVLLSLQRFNPRETMAEEDFKIAELRAESRAWKSGKEGEIEKLRSEYRVENQELAARMQALEGEMASKKKLLSGLETLQSVPLEFAAIKQELQALREEKALRDSLYTQELKNLEKELEVGIAPYRSEIGRLDARKRFDEEQLVVDIEIRALFDGVVGNISCKKGEHIPSFSTIMTYYEPNPTMVKGYLYEGQLLEAGIRDSFIVRSTQDPNLSCKGVVTGLGSRIVEIPARLRKIEEVKTYGREVLISISPDNPFIQKEKVMLEFF